MSMMISSPVRLIGDVFGLIYRGASGYEVRLWPDATLALSGETGDYWVNTAVIGDGPNAGLRLREAIATFRDRSLSGWIMHDESIAGQLAPIALAADLQDGGTVPLMVYRPIARSAQPDSSGDVRVERVRDERGLQEANRVMAAAFETPLDIVNRIWTPMLIEAPGFDCFLARRADEPIGIVMTVRHGPVIGIWTMGTLPECQRQGIGRHLLNAIIHHHVQLGAETFYLLAFAAGKRLYDQTGFETVSDIHLWISSGPGTDSMHQT